MAMIMVMVMYGDERRVVVVDGAEAEETKI